MKTGKLPIVWSIALVVLLVALSLPLLNVIAVFLLMVPYVVLYRMLPVQWFAVHVALAWIAAFVVGGAGTVMVGLFFLLPGIVMGHLYRKNIPAGKVIRITTLALIGQMLLQLLLLQITLGFSVMAEMGEAVRSMVMQLKLQSPAAFPFPDEAIEELIRMMKQALPLTFMIMAFILAALAQYIARRALAKADINVLSFPKAHAWRLPRIMTLYYLIIIVMQLMIPINDGSFMSIVIFTLYPLLSYVFAIQAIGFFYFIAHERGWNKAIPFLIAIPVLLFQPLSLIGVLDTAFPIRKAFKKK